MRRSRSRRDDREFLSSAGWTKGVERYLRLLLVVRVFLLLHHFARRMFLGAVAQCFELGLGDFCSPRDGECWLRVPVHAHLCDSASYPRGAEVAV